VLGHKIGGGKGKRDEYGKLYVEMNVGKPLLDIETWTLLVNAREISMTQDLGFRIVGTETLQKLSHRSLLGWRAGVGRMTIGIQTTLVTDADTAGVVMTGMCTRLRLRTARINHSVLRDVIVITDVTETTG
jgi:hypothetical protein